MPDVPDALHNQLALVTEVRNTLFPNLVGKPLNDPKKAFAVTKNVAWRLRAHGVGLVKAKQGSANNVEGFTSDIVALANGVHWDVLVDGHDGAAFPNWAMEENPANYPPIAARWVPPINPGGTSARSRPNAGPREPQGPDRQGSGARCRAAASRDRRVEDDDGADLARVRNDGARGVEEHEWQVRLRRAGWSADRRP